jgi:hypothetical protein
MNEERSPSTQTSVHLIQLLSLLPSMSQLEPFSLSLPEFFSAHPQGSSPPPLLHLPMKLLAEIRINGFYFKSLKIRGQRGQYLKAGCAGSASSILYQRSLLQDVLLGAATTAPAQHSKSIESVERSISEIGVVLARRGVECRRVWERILVRGAYSLPRYKFSHRWRLAY